MAGQDIEVAIQKNVIDGACLYYIGVPLIPSKKNNWRTMEYIRKYSYSSQGILFEINAHKQEQRNEYNKDGILYKLDYYKNPKFVFMYESSGGFLRILWVEKNKKMEPFIYKICYYNNNSIQRSIDIGYDRVYTETHDENGIRKEGLTHREWKISWKPSLKIKMFMQLYKRNGASKQKKRYR